MATLYGANVVRDGLICHIDAKNQKCWSGSGTVMTDISSNSNNGKLLGNSVTNGEIKNTDRFDSLQIYTPTGANNNAHDFSSYNNITVELLYRRDSVNNIGTGGVGQPSYYQGVFNYYWQGGHQIYVGTNSNASSTNLTIFGVNTTLELDQWVYISGITGPGGKQAFINGSSIGTATGATFDPDKRIFVGNWDTSWASFCSISEFRMYNRALTESEIKQNFNALRGRYGI